MEVSRKDGGFCQAVVIERQQRSQNAVVRINASFIISFQGDDDQASESCLFMAYLSLVYISGNIFFKDACYIFRLSNHTFNNCKSSLQNEELQHFSAINISFFILTLYLHTCCVSSNTFINIENRAPPTIKPLISKCLSSYNSASFPVQLVQRVVYMS